MGLSHPPVKKEEEEERKKEEEKERKRKREEEEKKPYRAHQRALGLGAWRLGARFSLSSEQVRPQVVTVLAATQIPAGKS